MRIFTLTLFLNCLFLQSAERYHITPLLPNEQLLKILVNENAEPIPPEHLRIAGNFNPKDLSVSDIKKIVVEDRNGKKYQLNVGEDGLVKEFGEIVSLWFYFDAPQSYIDNGGIFFLSYNESENQVNRFTDPIAAKPEQKDFLRTFSWNTTENETDPDTANFATIQVIADSRADYFFLWYLLPMAVIFAILAIRKKSLYKNTNQNKTLT